MKKIPSLCSLLKEFDNKLPGGKADNKNPSDFDQNQLMKGIRVEFEHTNDISLAMEIAMDHLTEDEEYYTNLEKIHKD